MSRKTPIEQLVEEFCQLYHKAHDQKESEQGLMIHQETLACVRCYLTLLDVGNTTELSKSMASPSKHTYGTDAQGCANFKEINSLYLSFLMNHDDSLNTNYKNNAHTALFLIDLRKAENHLSASSSSTSVSANSSNSVSDHS